MDISISHGRKLLRVFIIYRPPTSVKNKLKFSTFLDEFSTLIEPFPSITSKVIILGDFNLHVDDGSNCDACKFLELLTSADLCQLVYGPTHVKGQHWIWF